MSLSPSQPTLDFYRRADCHLCDEARLALQQVLEERVMRGDPIPRVRYVDVDGDPADRAAYGARVPVLTLGAQELSLVVSHSSIARFLDRALGRAA